MARSRLSGALATSESLYSGTRSRSAILITICRDGYSQHADYVFGWKGDSLQRAMDARCTGNVCSQLKSQTWEEATKCTKSAAVKENIDGCKSHLLPVSGRSHRLNPADHLAGLSQLPGITTIT
jgi:hypothetical protein